MSEALLSGLDIGKVMASTGPIVKCVILRARSLKSGIDPNRDVTTMSIKDIKRELESYGSDTSLFLEKDDLVKALAEARSKLKNPDEPTTTSSDAPRDDQSDCNDAKETAGVKVVPLTHLIEEIEVDTTPNKSMVSNILGGQFTFVGQYEDEGIMVMVRRPDWENEDSTIDDADIPPLNPHRLQPPLQDIELRGDILLMRVAETEEELDYDSDESEDDAKKGNDNVDVQNGGDRATVDGEQSVKSSSEPVEDDAEKAVVVPSNDDFFLDYTRDEYLKFAARTDIVAKEIEESEDDQEEESEEEEVSGSGEESVGEKEKSKLHETNGVAAEANDEEDGDEEHDEDYEPEEEEEDFDSEEHQVGMMNLILGQILRKFHEENGRGPDTLELLEMRKALADRLGVEVPPVDEDACDWDKKVETPKRHNKKVVVAEEKNKSETIPRDDDYDDDDALVGLKRPASVMESKEDEEEQQESSKKAKLDEGSGSNVGGES